MRVFMTADAVGGVWTYSVDLARGLSAYGVETTLAVMGPAPSEAQRNEAARVEGLVLIETGLELDWRADGVHDVEAAAERLSGLVQAGRPDVVHLNSPSLAALADFGPRIVGACHSCTATWWEATHTGDLPEQLRWQRDLLARGYAGCDVLVAPTASFARSTARHYGYHPVVVHNGRAAFGRTDEERERCVLTAGRLWDGAKNLATLDAVAGLLDAPVYAAGALRMPPGEAIPVTHVTPLGSLAPASLRSRMTRSAVFASLAVYEPFGLSVLEAAQCGCALVLSDIDTFRELWHGAAIFVPQADVETCADVLKELLDDPALAAAWGAQARLRAESYSLERVAANMRSLYRSLLQQSEVAA
jgi:glycosyltransferase involved in cell wall biosynthesis